MFAPTNDAFRAPSEQVGPLESVPEATAGGASLTALLEPENQETLTKILTYHVIEGEVLSQDLTTGNLATLEGNDLFVFVGVPEDEPEGDAEIFVSDGLPAAGQAQPVEATIASVNETDIDASNGVIHVIDAVLIPPDVTLPA